LNTYSILQEIGQNQFSLLTRRNFCRAASFK